MPFYCYNKNDFCGHSEDCNDCNVWVHGKGGKEVPTNADRIRAMSDEELAEKLYRDVIGFICRGKRERNEPCSEYGCKDCVLEWLKQPVEEDRL